VTRKRACHEALAPHIVEVMDANAIVEGPIRWTAATLRA
jgi:hypothetical protein